MSEADTASTEGEGGDIWGDLRAGWPPVPLTELPSQSWVPRRNGRKRHVCWGFRKAKEGERGADGRRVLLETARMSGRLVTTEPAWERFCRRLTAPAEPPPPIRTPARRRRDLERAERILESARI